MDMFNILMKAQKEGTCHKADILCWLRTYMNTLGDKRIKACDVTVPTSYLYAIEGIADDANIPCRYICGNTFSIALTYSDLLKHERER